MTVSTTSQSIPYDCNGSLKIFSFPFSIEEKTDIKVILTNPAGTKAVLIYPDDYTVDGIPIDWDEDLNPIAWDFSNGGTVTTVATYASGYSLLIESSTPLTQEVSFSENTSALYKTFEGALDKLTRIAKEQEARIAVVELAAFLGGTVPSAQITYLGRLAVDPDTTGWGTAEENTCWYNLTDHHAKYWNGTRRVEY